MRIALLTYSTKPRGGVVHTLALAEALAATGADVTVWSLGRGDDTRFYRPVDPRVRLSIVPFHHVDTFTTPELVACHERAIVRPFAHVCVSAAVAGELARGWGLKATVIPNGVDSARFAAAAAGTPSAEADRAVWRKRFGRYVVTVGGIEPRKGSMDLLEAYSLLQATDSGLRLVIAGGETLFDYRDYRAGWEKRAAELGVSPVVLGPVADADLPSLVAAAEVFAFPSHKEGFGLAPMEALAAGVPLVVSDLPVLREVFRDAASYASSPAELARQLLAARNHDRRAEGRAVAAGYTWETAAKAHLDLYQRL